MERMLSSGDRKKTMDFLLGVFGSLAVGDENAPWLARNDESKNFWMKRLARDLGDFFSCDDFSSPKEEQATVIYFERIISLAEKISKKALKSDAEKERDMNKRQL